MDSDISFHPGDLVDECEAAAILDIGIRTLRNWRTLRKGPPYRKIGQRLVRYHRGDLASFIGSSPMSVDASRK
jgi:hypothetical protein